MEEIKVYVSIDDTGMYNYENRFGGTYLHGTLEQENHYDIFAFEKKMELEEGAHDFLIDKRPCTFFLWKSNFRTKYWRGFLVLKSDKEDYEYCKCAFEEREQNI